MIFHELADLREKVTYGANRNDALHVGSYIALRQIAIVEPAQRSEILLEKLYRAWHANLFDGVCPVVELSFADARKQGVIPSLSECGIQDALVREGLNNPLSRRAL